MSETRLNTAGARFERPAKSVAATAAAVHTPLDALFVRLPLVRHEVHLGDPRVVDLLCVARLVLGHVLLFAQQPLPVGVVLLCMALGQLARALVHLRLDVLQTISGLPGRMARVGMEQ